MPYTERLVVHVCAVVCRWKTARTPPRRPALQAGRQSEIDRPTGVYVNINTKACLRRPNYSQASLIIKRFICNKKSENILSGSCRSGFRTPRFRGIPIFIYYKAAPPDTQWPCTAPHSMRSTRQRRARSALRTRHPLRKAPCTARGCAPSLAETGQRHFRRHMKLKQYEKPGNIYNLRVNRF